LAGFVAEVSVLVLLSSLATKGPGVTLGPFLLVRRRKVALERATWDRGVLKHDESVP
jgi:hypothetical protein